MSKSVLVYWAPTNTDGIAEAQDATVGNPLVLKTTTGYPPASFVYKDILPLDRTFSKDVIRSIDISSPDDIKDTVFVLSGIGVLGTDIDAEGNPTKLIGPITEEITGINNTVVPTEGIYTELISVIPTVADATNVSIGYGTFGIINYIFTDTNRNVIQNYSNSWSTQIFNFNALIPTIYISLNTPQRINPTGNLATFGVIQSLNEILPDFIPAFPLTPQTTVGNNTLGSMFNSGCATIWATIKDNTDANESMFFTFIQQGI